MPENPYEPPKGQAVVRPSVGLWLVAVTMFSGLLASVSCTGCVGTVVYRLKHTEAMGRSLTPPPVPLNVADWIIFLFALGALLFTAVCALSVYRWLKSRI